MNLAAIAQKWAKVLRLADWNISVIADGSLKAPIAGYCDAMADYKDAVITVATWPDEKTIEDTIVHELLHLHLSPFKTEAGTAGRTWEEQAVESITRGFMDIARNGAPIAAVERRARLIVATTKNRLARRYRMDPKRYGEIMMELGSMDLDPKAKALVAELASMTVGGDGPTTEDAPLAEEKPKPGDLPMAGDKPVDPAVARTARLVKKAEKLAESQYQRLLISEARTKLGAECTPDFERKLMAATPEIAEAMLEGAVSRGPAKQTIVAREGVVETEQRGNVVPLRRGEDVSKLTPLQRQVRSQISNQIGASQATKAIQASGGKPSRSIGRAKGGSQ